LLEAALKIDPENKVKIVVTQSGCPLMKKGATVYLNGPVIDYRESAPVCVTALVGIYPWIMTARFGIESAAMGFDGEYRVSCPDKLVEFAISSSQPGSRF
jgi:uncharacterized repeat protein (TIGR04076 family)